MRRLFLATSIGVSSLTASAQLPPEDWFSSCDGPSATCIFPHVGHLVGYSPYDVPAMPGDSLCDPIALLTEAARAALASNREHRTNLTVAYFEPSLLPIADDAREILKRWSIASQSHLPVTDAERMRMRYSAPERSGQELTLSCELTGPVDAADLMRRYDWVVTDDADAVALTAVPHDRLERLFYKTFTVTLDAATWRPTSVSFATPGHERSTVVALQPWVDEAEQGIQVVAYRPNSEAGELIRTADVSESGTTDGTLETEPLELPPAPAPCETDEARLPVEAPRP